MKDKPRGFSWQDITRQIDMVEDVLRNGLSMSRDIQIVTVETLRIVCEYCKDLEEKLQAIKHLD